MYQMDCLNKYTTKELILVAGRELATLLVIGSNPTLVSFGKILKLGLTNERISDKIPMSYTEKQKTITITIYQCDYCKYDHRQRELAINCTCIDNRRSTIATFLPKEIIHKC